MSQISRLPCETWQTSRFRFAIGTPLLGAGQAFGTTRSFSKQDVEGFTLMEAVVSVAIFGLLMLAVAALWGVCWRASERIEHTKNPAKQADVVLKRLGEAVEASIFHPQPKGLYAWETEDNRGGAEKSDSVSFVTALAPDAAESADGNGPPERVKIRVRHDTDGESRLILLVAPFTMEEDDWQREVVLLENVTAFRVRYWDTSHKDWMDGWKDEEHAPETVQFAIAVKDELAGVSTEAWTHLWTARTHPAIELANLAPLGGMAPAPEATSTNPVLKK